MTRRLILLVCFSLMLSGIFALKMGYALSGGGARGFAHIGMLKVLEEYNIHPQYISGTSIGSLIGGFYAMGYNAAQIESIFVNTNWEEIYSDDWKRDELYIGQKRWAPYGGAFFRLDKHWTPQLPQSVIVGNRINLELFRAFSPAYQIQDFKDLPIPFSCVATDLVTGQLKVFDSGSLMQGIRASMSIPSVLQPFPMNKTLYIDGGISQNLPGKQVKDMGADFVIGLKVNSSLRSVEQLQGIIHVLDQTVNIGITSKLNEEISYCDYILDPELPSYSATSFTNIEEIIRSGEEYARQHIDEIKEIAEIISKSDTPVHQVTPLPPVKKLNVVRIAVQGNNDISAAKIREYLGMEADQKYTISQIIDRFHQAWNSQLFDIIYPVIEPEENGVLLKAIVKERERKYLATNFSYSSEDEFTAGAVLSLQNYIMRNSQVYAELKLAGKHELNIDLVKNFGDDFGIYYRLFPYLCEKQIYFYNDNHDKITSARSLEYGVTTGIGMFARKSVVLEGYSYSYYTKLSREISVSDTLEKSVQISGIGFKAYHESLDDYIFPKNGMKAFIKTSFARDDILSDESLNKLFIDCKIYRPVNRYLSALLGMQYGSHFKSNEQSNFDPFYLGGLESFAGFPYYEKSAPFYKLIQAGIVVNPLNSLYITTKLQALSYSNSEVWDEQKTFVLGGVIEVGLKSYLGPLRLACAISEESVLQFYLELGYTSDIFHFSRR